VNLSVIVDLSRVAVGALLLAAVIMKLAAPSDLAAAATRLGVPRRLVLGRSGQALRPVLVVAELVMAAGLMLPVSSRAAGAATATVLLCFGAFMAQAIRRGVRGDCGCFGVASGEISWFSVARNGLGGAAALVVAVYGVPHTQSAMRLVTVPMVTAIVGLLIALVLLARAYRLRSEESPAEAGPPGLVSSQINSAWVWRMADGTKRAAGALLMGRPCLLVFTDPGCAPCEVVLSHLRSNPPLRDDRRLILVSRGSLDDNLKISIELPGIPIVVQDDFEIARGLGVSGTPVAVQLTSAGVVVEAQTSGAAAVTALMDALFRPIAAGR
jgi:hypothetical protein